MLRAAHHAVLAALMLLTPLVRADITDYDWPYTEAGGGIGTLSRTDLKIDSAFKDGPGTTYFTATAPVGCLILFDFHFGTNEYELTRYAFYSINDGAPTVFADDNHMNGVVGFSLNPNDTFTIGTVISVVDHVNLDVHFGDFGTLVARGMADFDWLHYDGPAGNGSGYATPPYTLHVTGGSAGHSEDTAMYMVSESPALFYIEGYYSTDDQGLHSDSAYWATSAGTEYFMDNQNQGFWSFMDQGMFKDAGQTFGVGIVTDGLGGRGYLDTTNFFSWVYTHQVEDVPWQTFDDASELWTTISTCPIATSTLSAVTPRKGGAPRPPTR